jgi:hypothetical protein
MANICTTCNLQVADGAAFCPQCGGAVSPLAAAPTDSPPAQPGAPSGGAGVAPAGGTPAFHFNAARWSTADRIAGIASLVLLISLFLPWFSVSALGFTVSADGLGSHGFLYLVMIVSILILAYLVLRAGWDTLPVSTSVPHETTLLIATAFNAVLVVIAFLWKPGGSLVGWSFGSFLALIAAIVAVGPLIAPIVQGRRAGQ